MSQCFIILAAGRGSRMGQKTKNIPKGLIPIKGISPVVRQLTHSSNLSIENNYIVTGYLAEKYQSVKAECVFNEHWSNSNMVYSLKKIFKSIKKFNQYIVSYSDIFYEQNALEMVKNSSDECSILFDRNWKNLWERRFVNPLIDAETFKINDLSEVVEIGKAPSSLDEIQGQYMGLTSFSFESLNTLFKYVEADPSLDIMKLDMTSAINMAIEKKLFTVKGIPYDGEWGEVDTISDFELYNKSM